MPYLEKLRRVLRLFALVVFNEIEKAHRNVCNVLRQIMEDVILTDGKVRTVDLENMIVIMTSDVGSDVIGMAGGIRGNIKKLVTGTIDKIFSSGVLQQAG